MHFGTLLARLSLFFTGILAGVEVVIHCGLRGPAAILDERSRLQ
jgi:hypothetical protein